MLYEIKKNALKKYMHLKIIFYRTNFQIIN